MNQVRNQARPQNQWRRKQQTVDFSSSGNVSFPEVIKQVEHSLTLGTGDQQQDINHVDQGKTVQPSGAVHLAPKPQRPIPRPIKASQAIRPRLNANPRPQSRVSPFTQTKHDDRNTEPQWHGSSSSSQVIKGVIDLMGNDPPPTTGGVRPQLKLSLKKNPPPVLAGMYPKSNSSIKTDEATTSSSSSQINNRKGRRFFVPEEIPVFNADDPRINGLGRTLSRILRHQAVELGIKIGSDGFCKVDQLLKLRIRTHFGLPICSHTVEDIRRVVMEDPKQRFSFKVQDEIVYMRANQGHSMKAVLSDQLLKEITDADQVPVCVHGTLKVHLPSIMKFGLNRMGRNHIHFATGLPKAQGVVSGMRETCEVLIYLDVKKALADGIKLYISDNKVVLTEGFAGIISREYFEKVLEWPGLRPL